MPALARGLMSDPTLLLLDEPSLGLAPQIAEQMFQTIARIPDGGHSILIVEQDITGTLRIADYGYVMENGRITIEGEPAQLRDKSSGSGELSRRLGELKRPSNTRTRPTLHNSTE